MQRVYGGAILLDKMKSAALRVLAACYSGKSGRIRHGEPGGKILIKPVEAFTAGGTREFDTYLKQASKRYFIKDDRGIGYLFLRDIIDGAAALGETVEISYDAFSGKRERSVYLSSASVAFVPLDEEKYIANNLDKLINMDRFINLEILKQYKSGIKFAKKYRDLLLNGAAEEYDINLKLHSRLEALYGAAMDFKRKEDYTKKLLIKIFN